jgi:peptidoglycan/LPS O-acetylase OafA/YrhL
MLSFEGKSALAGDRSNGFDYLRILLAISIIAWHSVSVSYGADFEAKYMIPIRSLVLFLVPSFFALSGYLVAGSLFRTDHLPTFLTLRALRIFPALCCEVVISAMIIGPALTSLPLADYFSSHQFSKYFLNIFGYIQYYLPGVFQNNHYAAVNNQLWTIPFELECYIAIGLLYILTLHRRPRLFLGVLFLCTIALTAHRVMISSEDLTFKPSGRFAVAAFLWGVLAFCLRDKIIHNGYLFVLALLTAWFSLFWREGEFFAAPAIAYMTIYIGLCDFKKTFILRAGDVSYGIYLYGFAIQQAVYQLTPAHYRSWAENFIVSLAIALFVGYLSWTYVESKVLNKKKAAIKFIRSLTDRISPWRVRMD